MSIAAGTTSYMSNASIMEWMESKTERLYEQMRTSMDSSNNRVDAEDALNNIKAKIDELEASGKDATELRDMMTEAVKKYGAEFPEVKEALQPMLDDLNKRIEDAQPKLAVPSGPPSKGAPTLTNQGSGSHVTSSDNNAAAAAAPKTASLDPKPVKISEDDAKRWNDAIKNKTDVLGKQDQLGMVHIQDFNAQLNRTKDMASSLMAAADKASDSIVSHIG